MAKKKIPQALRFDTDLDEDLHTIAKAMGKKYNNFVEEILREKVTLIKNFIKQKKDG